MCPTIQFRLRVGDERIFAGCAASSPICFFFALLTLARFSINIGFVERPLAVGFIWSLWTGDLSTGLALGVFFELFGLDYLAAGSYLPPNPLFPLLVSLLWVGQTAINEPSYVAAFAVWSCPLAYLGAYMEQQQRRWQSRGYTELLEARHSVAGLEKVAERRILLAMGQLFAASFALFIVGGSFWYAVYAALVKGTRSSLAHACLFIFRRRVFGFAHATKLHYLRRSLYRHRRLLFSRPDAYFIDRRTDLLFAVNSLCCIDKGVSRA